MKVTILNKSFAKFGMSYPSDVEPHWCLHTLQTDHMNQVCFHFVRLSTPGAPCNWLKNHVVLSVWMADGMWTKERVNETHTSNRMRKEFECERGKNHILMISFFFRFKLFDRLHEWINCWTYHSNYSLCLGDKINKKPQFIFCLCLHIPVSWNLLRCISKIGQWAYHIHIQKYIYWLMFCFFFVSTDKKNAGK